MDFKKNKLKCICIFLCEFLMDLNVMFDVIIGCVYGYFMVV